MWFELVLLQSGIKYVAVFGRVFIITIYEDNNLSKKNVHKSLNDCIITMYAYISLSKKLQCVPGKATGETKKKKETKQNSSQSTKTKAGPRTL